MSSSSFHSCRPCSSDDNQAINQDGHFNLISFLGAVQINPFSYFVHMVRGFGLKFQPADENHIEYRSDNWFASPQSITGESSVIERSYNIRYFEKQNRQDVKAIWSERQVAAYHRLDILNRASIWVLIQPSESAKVQIRQALTSVFGLDLALKDHMEFHILIFREFSKGWRPYLNFLEMQVSALV